MRDPPELKQFSARGDPPISKWPGDPITRQDVMRATGHPKDWFRYRHREVAFESAWLDFASARRRRRNFMRDFQWNQILIIGEYGAQKTSLAAKIARYYLGLGHAVFSNASLLMGWHLRRDRLYTSMGFMPTCAVLIVDEASAALASRMGHSVAVSTFVEMNLNIRVRNCIVIYISAQDRAIAPAIRYDCKEVWMPIAQDEVGVVGGGGPSDGRAADDPANFRLAWHVWTDYPYQKGNLIEGEDPNDTKGFGPPEYSKFDEGEAVRDAYLLNDSFELKASGAATVSNRDAIKEATLAFLEGRTPDLEMSRNGSPPLEDNVHRLLQFLETQSAKPPEYIRASDIGRALGISSPVAGKLIQSVLPVVPVQRKGYPSESVYQALDHLMES